MNTPAHPPLATTFRPERLDVRAFAHQQAELSGTLNLAQLERLAQDAFEMTPQDLRGIPVQWSAQGQWRDIRGGAAQTWLLLSARLSMPLQCQRCLTAVQRDLVVERAFHFVSDEATAQVLDEDSDDDVLVASKTFNLIELIEDELLMALPLVPLHEHCPVPVTGSFVSEGFEDDETPVAAGGKPNPFAVLQSLRGKAGQRE